MTDEIAKWLDDLGLGQHARMFADNAIDRRSLPHLSEDDLKELGLPLGHRRILQAALSQPERYPTAATVKQPERPSNEAERRQLTILFCDLVGSTALAAKLDPEDLREVIGNYHRCCAETIERQGGFIAKYMGDGVLAYFGYPRAHEHDPEHAVQTGLSLANAVPRLATVVDAPLQVRIGIATGTVIVGDLLGTGEAQERGVVGDTPNLAARLQSIAEPGMVVIADGTRRLLGNLFELEDLGTRELKGIQGSTRAWAALGAGSLESRFDALSTTGTGDLIGRDEQSELLLRRWSRAKSGEGQVVQLSGEAGIGKSHLVATLMTHVDAEAHRRLRYFCSPQHIDSALHPVIEQIKRAAGLAEGENDQSRLDKLDGLLAAAMTEPEDAALLAELLSLADDGRYPRLELTPPQRRQRTLQALATQMSALAHQDPVLMIFEDAHWADPSTLELLSRTVDRIANLPVLLVVTCRPEFRPPWVGLPHVTALTLNRLTERSVEALIDSVTGNRQLPASVRQDIIERTDGVPLFIEEMTKAVLESESDGEALRIAAGIPAPAPAVPASLHASLMARLDRLGPAKEVVQVGAAIGREFSHALLSAVMRKPESELAASLDRLAESDLISRQGASPHATYLFKHALMQDTAYGLLLREPRRALHARIAEALQGQFVEMAAAEPEIVAHHFSQADMADQASLWFERAGDRSVSRSAYAEAFAHFSAALAQASKLPAGKDRDQRELAILLKHGPAVMLLKGQRGADVEQIYRRAYEIAKAVGDERQKFKPLWGLWLTSNLNRRTDRARDLAEELLGIGVRSGQEDLILEAVHCRWSTANFRGDVAAAIAAGQDGIRDYDSARHGHLGPEFGGHDAGVCAHAVVALGFAQQGNPRKAVDHVERAIALARSLNQPSSVAFAIMLALATYQITGDRGAVARLAPELIELADTFHMPPHRSVANYFSAWARACEDNLDVGLQAMEAEFPRVSAMGSMPDYCAGLLASVRLQAEQVEPALELLDSVLDLVREPGVGLYVPEIHRLRGACLLRLPQSRFDAATRAFDQAIATAQQQQARLFQLTAAIDLARAWSSVGNPGRGVGPLRAAVSLFADDDVPPELAIAQGILSRSTR